MKFTKKDFRIDTFRSGGKGGQHQNKTDSGVRITHIETGLSSECRETRSQDTNKEKAFRKLCNKLIQYYELKDNAIKIDVRELKTIRTYNESRNIVKDEQSGDTTRYKDVIEKGDSNIISEMIETRNYKQKINEEI